jgi:hypothetical protein
MKPAAVPLMRLSRSDFTCACAPAAPAASATTTAHVESDVTCSIIAVETSRP